MFKSPQRKPRDRRQANYSRIIAEHVERDALATKAAIAVVKPTPTESRTTGAA